MPSSLHLSPDVTLGLELRRDSSRFVLEVSHVSLAERVDIARSLQVFAELVAARRRPKLLALEPLTLTRSPYRGAAEIVSVPRAPDGAGDGIGIGRTTAELDSRLGA